MSLDLQLNRSLAPDIFRIAHRHEMGTSSGGSLSSIAMICYYVLEGLDTIRGATARLFEELVDSNSVDVASVSSLMELFDNVWEGLSEVTQSYINQNNSLYSTENVMLVALTMGLLVLSHLYISRRRPLPQP